ncbi:MAG: hypothetical protein ACFFAA_13720 [Promethearchaeota archaeon]
MKKISNVTKGLIVATFLITIITFLTTANAYAFNHVLFIAQGDDLDLDGTTDFIIGRIKGDEAKAVFHQKIYDESGKQVYVMKGILKEGLLQTKYYYFFCPVFEVWFINVWLFMGDGIFKTTDTDLDLIYRNWFPITMPNTEGEYVPAQMVMLLSPTAEYCSLDPSTNPPGPNNPVLTNPDWHAWVLTAVLCGIIVETPTGQVELPIGPVSYLTKSWGL